MATQDVTAVVFISTTGAGEAGPARCASHLDWCGSSRASLATHTTRSSQCQDAAADAWIAGTRSCVGVGQHAAPKPLEVQRSRDPAIKELSEKLAFDRKALSQTGYGPKYGLVFFRNEETKKP